MMQEITLSDDQEIVFNKIAKWISDGDPISDEHRNPFLLTLGGFAGSGKSTLVSLLAKQFDSAVRFAFCALSGRAASVLENKLKASGFDFEARSHFCGTIHRLLYQPIENDDGEVVYWAKRKEIDFDIIVLDEASMVSEYIYRDLASYGIPILAVGDHGQLPPIEGRLSLMENPDLKLEKIHRQAQDNPIINLSMQIRKNGKFLKEFADGNYVKILKKKDYKDYISEIYKARKSPEELLETAFICYMNVTRAKLNMEIRNMVFGSFSKVPVANDIVVCLKNTNDRTRVPLYNGFRGFFSSSVETSYDYHSYSGNVKFPDENIDIHLGDICRYQFGYNKTFSSFSELRQFGMRVRSWEDVGLLFDFGYAMTCHKFQGSQVDHVLLYNERPRPVDDEGYKRWAYTAVSRAVNDICVFL